jgi:hypothetical protein
MKFLQSISATVGPFTNQQMLAIALGGKIIILNKSVSEQPAQRDFAF